MDYLFQAFFKESHFFQTKKNNNKETKVCKNFFILYKTYISNVDVFT